MLDSYRKTEIVKFVGKKQLTPELGCVVAFFYSIALVKDSEKKAPRWAFLLCALGLFVYQSLDAIDGKQARRTDSSTPLGELFDHGCDSISTVFVALSACIATQLGHCPAWMFFQCFCALTLFYCAHWQTYVSGMLRFGRVDVTEAQFTIMFIHLISAAFGSEVWSNKVGFLDFVELRFGMVLMTIVCGSVSLFNIFTVIFTGGVGKNGSTVAMSILNMQYNQSFGAIFFLGYSKVFIDFCQRFQAGGAGKNGSSVALPWCDWQWKVMPGVVGTCVAAYLFHSNMAVIFTGGVGKNGSSVAVSVTCLVTLLAIASNATL
ncbi:hypothetical protein J6590_070898 [Homalodisca vitripennis]|nr:hypothetical protein J6590_070898 [Homalodisca vitripennis]